MLPSKGAASLLASDILAHAVWRDKPVGMLAARGLPV